jgi:hypothetical protein
MPGCLGIGHKQAHLSLPFTQGCSEAAVETTAGPNRAPLGLNRPQERFWLRTFFIIAVPRVTPSPGTG